MKSSEKSLESLAKNLPALLWAAGADGAWTFVNERWREVMGQPAEEAFGQGWMACLHPDDTQKIFKLYQETVEKKEPIHLEMRLKKQNGHYGWFLLKAEYSKDISGFVGLGLDISHFKQIEYVKDEFVSTVSHELRTPLSIAREGISQILDGLCGNITQEQKKMLLMIIANHDRLERIIHDLLDISELEANAGDLKREILDLGSVARETIETFKVKAKAKRLLLKEDYPAWPVEVYANKDKIIQVFTNLLGNAFKFTETGTITVSVSEKDSFAECRVTDTGKGIAAEDLPFAFKKFQQFGRVPGPGEKGTGLGLAISKGIVEMHGGRIWAESKLNEGSCFAFSIPKYAVEDLFREYIKDCVTVAQKQKNAFSVLAFDFKNWDSFGRTLGEEKAKTLLFELKNRVKSELRRRFFTVFLPPEHFAVALPLASRDETLKIAENLRLAFDKVLKEKHPKGNLEMKARVICFPADANSAEDMYSLIARHE